MKIFFAVLALIATVSAFTFAGTPSTDTDIDSSVFETAPIPDDFEAVANEGIADFSSRFCLTAAKNAKKDTDILVSPFSAYVAMAMLREAADGETLDELSTVLGNADTLYISNRLSSRKDSTFNSANSIWADKGTLISEDYVNTLRDMFRAEHFVRKLADAEKEVNSWISDKTNGLIKNMLSDNALDNSAAALVNAIYFKGTWSDTFSEYMTEKRDFTNSDGSVTVRDFMRNGEENELVISTDDYLGVVLNYLDCDLRYIALMPRDEKLSLDILTEKVASDGGFAALGEAAQRQNCRLFLPKYESKVDTSLTELFEQMGVRRVFTHGAELPSLTNGAGDSFFVDKVLQSAVMKVDEGGTEAAAATAVTMAPTSAPPSEKPEPIVVDFNRPFVYAVYDSKSGAVMFFGAEVTA